MNSRERLRRCYFHEELDRPGVYSRTGFPKNDPSYDRLKAYLREHSELKRGWNAWFEGGRHVTERRTEPYSEEFAREVTVLHTPAGDLESSRLVGLKNQPGLMETYFIETRADAETYLSLPTPAPPPTVDVSSFFEADREIGGRGIVDVLLGGNAVGRTVPLFGSETFAMMSVTDRDIIHLLLERHMRTTLDRLKALIERGIGPFFSMSGHEYVVPPMHSPADFDEFNARYDKPIVDLIHEAGGRIHVHCHGSVKTVLKSFIEGGVDVLHPFEAPPMGDLTPAEAKETARGRLCLEGNIQIADMYESTPEKIREQTCRLIEACFDDRRGLIVCPTASPYIYGKGEEAFANYKSMIDTVLEYGP